MIPETLLSFDVLAVVVIAVLVSLLLRRKDDAPKAPTTTRGAFNLTIRHTHELAPETVAQLGVMLETTVTQVWTQHAAPLLERAYPPLQPAQRFEARPEPEERMAHDLKRAHAVLRGAEQLQQAAKAAGKHLPLSDAMQQAASMLDRLYDPQEPTT